MGTTRNFNMTKAVQKYLSEIGSRGGKAGRGKVKARTTKQARAAAMARWAKVNGKVSV